MRIIGHMPGDFGQVLRHRLGVRTTARSVPLPSLGWERWHR